MYAPQCTHRFPSANGTCQVWDQGGETLKRRRQLSAAMLAAATAELAPAEEWDGGEIQAVAQLPSLRPHPSPIAVRVRPLRTPAT